jgi:uncharacterized membrane protein
MTQEILNLIRFVPNEMAIVLLAAMPVVELRAAIPVGIGIFHLSAFSAYMWSAIGNLIPLVLLFLYLPKFITALSIYSPKMHEIFERYFFRLSEKHSKTLNRFGSFSLFIFVAIPYPGTGVWTACILAILFRLNPRFAIPSIILGMLASGLIVLSLTEASINLF